MEALFGLLGFAAAIGAALALRLAWRTAAPGPRRAGLILGGWGLAALSVAALVPAAGFDGGPVIAVCVLGAAAYVLVALGLDVRKPGRKAREGGAADPLDPVKRPMRWGRASLRFATAVVLAATAAFALAVAWSLHGVGSAADRVVLAAYVLPVLWGAAITWALADERLARPMAGLAVLTAAGAALALIPGGGA